VPPEYKGRADEYVDLVCDEMLPAAARAGLADAVDAFCEGIGFSPEQTSRVFEHARALGLPVKLHADQLSDLGGAGLAAQQLHNVLEQQVVGALAVDGDDPIKSSRKYGKAVLIRIINGIKENLEK